MIRKIKNEYVVLSEKTGRSFGRYKTKAEAGKRLRQVEFFKYLKRNKKEVNQKLSPFFRMRLWLENAILKSWNIMSV